jgi:hypothetical protein
LKITSYGLFWRADEIKWRPGRGAKGFRLLGRRGVNRPTVTLADFRKQQGIYILYNRYGANYVGLTRRQGLRKRLKDHLEDDLANKWERFSWFGFNEIGAPGADGVRSLKELADEVTEKSHTTIGDLEALLIRALGPHLNIAGMRFKDAEGWEQVADHEVQDYLGKVANGVV